MSRRLLTAWLMLVRLVLKAILVPSGSTSSRMSSDPRARMIGDLADVLGCVAGGGGGLMRMAIPSSARPGRSRFACPAEPHESDQQEQNIRVEIEPLLKETPPIGNKKAAPATKGPSAKKSS